MNTILVFNATGSQGQAITQRLKSAGHSIIAPVRSQEKAAQLSGQGLQAFVTDFSKASLVPELKKADQVVLQIPAQIAPSQMVSMARTAIDAIREAGYPKTVFVLSSTVPDQKVGVNSVDARVEMKDYALAHLPKTPILSATEYLENFATAYREPIERDGVIPQTIPPSYPVNYLSWDDLATYVEAALRSDGLMGKLYRIGGKEALDGQRLVQRLGAVLGRELKYVPITYEQLAGFLTPILGKSIATDYAEFYHYQDTRGQHLLNPDAADINTLLGIELPSFEEWAKRAFNQ